MIPGEYFLQDAAIDANRGRETKRLLVANTGDRPVQVGSHYHFREVNPALRFERGEANGMRLNTPAGTSVRFEPGEVKEVELTDFAGEPFVMGFRGESR